MERLTKENYRVSDWSGGRTIQIAIAPAGADYAARDFLWRLSSATVESDESDFTPLPDYERWIAPLRGEMRLAHNGGAAIELKEYETHRFDGAGATHSWGRCTDFNLMLRKSRCDGEIAALRGKAGDVRSVRAQRDELLLYCAAGAAEVEANGEAVMLAEAEAARFASGEAERVTLHFLEDGCVMAARIRSNG